MSLTNREILLDLYFMKRAPAAGAGEKNERGHWGRVACDDRKRRLHVIGSSRTGKRHSRRCAKVDSQGFGAQTAHQPPAATSLPGKI